MPQESRARQSVPIVTLSDRRSMPVIGYGAGTAHYQKECARHVLAALKLGYRLIDCAQEYENTESVGRALREWGGDREDVYILTKFRDHIRRHVYVAVDPFSHRRCQAEFQQDLLHHPTAFAPMTLAEAWKIMEQLLKEGLTRSIGISNFRERDLLELEGSWEVPPTIHQIEINPYVFHQDPTQRVLRFQEKHEIFTKGYASLRPLKEFHEGPVDPVIMRVGESRGVSVDLVLLAWAIRQCRGGIITTSSNEGRRREYLQATEVAEAMTLEEIKEVSEAGKRLNPPFRQSYWNHT